MNIINTLSKSRGTANSVRRAVAILRRFGITPRKIEERLNRYLDITGLYGCVPTFPTTAVTLKRHPDLIRNLSRRGAEFAVHGYIHTDYRSVSFQEQRRHLEKAIGIFESCHIPFSGFRAPYLRSNLGTLEAVGQLKLAYDSSRVIHWDVIDQAKYSKKGWKDYIKLLNFYQALDAVNHSSLPRFENGLVEIPVSIPDDEALVDRLGVEEKEEISKIWNMILQRTYDRGELFTIQLHHERISFCDQALEAVLKQARELDPPVWIATLREIAEWWREKNDFTLEVNAQGSGQWKIKANCSKRATVLLRNCLANKPMANWAGGYQSIDARDFVLISPSSPIIGMSPNCSQDIIRFLKSEGFVVEVADRPENYAIYFDNLNEFGENNQKQICEAIEKSTCPVLRYGRWPEKAKSSLAVTGDIDSITLIDFAMRVFEVWRQKGE